MQFLPQGITDILTLFGLICRDNITSSLNDSDDDLILLSREDERFYATWCMIRSTAVGIADPRANLYNLRFSTPTPP